MTDKSDLHFDGCVATNIEQTCRHLEQVYERLIAPLGLTVLEWNTLRALYEEDGLRASRLAARVCRHPSSMTALLDRMEAKGLLQRAINPNDRRSVRIHLTAHGRSFEPGVQAVAERITALTSRAITPQQMETFQYVLDVLQNLDPPG
jgi:DNA-binding MarR family transcriptional regulator